MVLNEISKFSHQQANEVKVGETFRLRFPFLLADVKNENGRLYAKSVVKVAVGELKRRLAKGQAAWGSTKHQDELELDDVASVVEDAEVDERGNAWATVRVLPTRRGKNLSAILRHGGQIGVSARGAGEVAENGAVKNYQIHGIDFVLDPAFSIGVSRHNVFESRMIDEVEESVLKERFYKACKFAGFNGTYQQYREATLKDQKKAAKRPPARP